MQATRPLTKPSKQRKMLYQAPDHVRHRLLAAHLSAELRASHGAKSFPVRTGDTVRVMRGDHKGVEGKINRVDLSKYRIYVEGLTREKVDGTTVLIPIHPSKVIVTRLNLDDKWRKEILEIKKEGRKKREKALEKPRAMPEEKPAEVAEVEEVVEEKPALKAKAPKKRVTRAKKRAPRKKVTEKVRPEVEETKKEEKHKPKKRTRRTSKTAKKTEEGEE